MGLLAVDILCLMSFWRSYDSPNDLDGKCIPSFTCQSSLRKLANDNACSVKIP